MKITHEALFTLRDVDFKVLHFFMGTHCSIRCIDDPNSEINQILDMDKEELESSIKRLEDLGYLIIYSTIIFNNNLEIV